MKEIEFKSIIENPVESYSSFMERLNKHGQMAPFPEFKEVVDFLLLELDSSFVLDILHKHRALLLELNEVKTFLFHLNLKIEIDKDIEYPYDKPFEDSYPYRPTIDAIESAIRFLDKINRLDENNKAVKLYHFDRYCYHRHALVTNQDVIIFPTIRELGMWDFIKIRSVPLEFVGVTSKTSRVDGHYQSPLDFWYHDFNHARRLWGYINKRLKSLGISEYKDKVSYYNKVNTFIFDILVANFLEIKSDDTENERAMKLLVTMIIFEVVHESAVTLERDELIKDILRGNGPAPYEYMHDGDNLDFEKLRTPVGNIESGASKNDLAKKTYVRYFLDPTSGGLLVNVYRKLNHFYYDETEEVDRNFIEAKYRTTEFILSAVRRIFEVIDYKENISDEEILFLIKNSEGTKEVILNKGLNSDDDSIIATEPLKADEVIEMITKRNKKVYTLFGYSALDYEDKDELINKLRSELETLSSAEYIICIGATEEGIGLGYKVAKDLGFETIGVVSTQALSYSGKFSDFVDMIYIVNDDLWGGFVPYSNKLAETTKTFLSISDTISAYGGGANTAITLEQADKLGIKTKFTPMQMSAEKAKKKNITNLQGEANAYWSKKL